MQNIFKFNNRFIEKLPADSDESNKPRQVFEACYSFVKPATVAAPKLVAVSDDVANLLAIPSAETNSETFAEVFSGNQLLDGMKPYAMCYGGHQFGHWAGQLGDGRAINLGEVIDKNGGNQTLQLKGSGLTPYSRTADGLAVLRSSVREFLCSEAMYYLGIPTTRALSLVLTGEKVRRDMFYDGNPELELGAIVCRVAPSFIRFGNFQIFSARKDEKNLKKLMDFCIRYDYPELLDEQQRREQKEITIEDYERWFDEVCQRTVRMVVEWMRVGFVHGVMNTDNMSILGLTIDYGPYGWLEGYEPGWTPNTTDAEGKRYCYGNQPQIAQWNLYQLANAIAPVIGRTEALENSLQNFGETYNEQAMNMYAKKLGLKNYEESRDKSLLDELFALLVSTEIDMTIFFRNLSQVCVTKSYHDVTLLACVKDAYYQFEQLTDELKSEHASWLRKYLEHLSQCQIDPAEKRAQMNSVNPKYVLRNYLAQIAIDKANEGDFSEVNKLLELLKKPYDEQPEHESYFQRRPEWARHKAGCSMLSCSS